MPFDLSQGKEPLPRRSNAEFVKLGKTDKERLSVHVRRLFFDPEKLQNSINLRSGELNQSKLFG